MTRGTFLLKVGVPYRDIRRFTSLVLGSENNLSFYLAETISKIPYTYGSA